MIAPVTVTVTNAAGDVIFIGQPSGAPGEEFCIHRHEDEPGRLSCSVTEVTDLSPIQQKLPAFSGEATPCPKCGYNDTPTTGMMYLSLGICDHATGNITSATGTGFNERVHRACFRCHYSWDEAVVS